MSNRRPIDRMADLKTQIATLEQEFAALRDQVIAGTVPQIGEEWAASVTLRTVRAISVTEAERLLPPDLFAAVTTSRQQAAVHLHRLHPVATKPATRKRRAPSRRS